MNILKFHIDLSKIFVCVGHPFAQSKTLPSDVHDVILWCVVATGINKFHRDHLRCRVQVRIAFEVEFKEINISATIFDRESRRNTLNFGAGDGQLAFGSRTRTTIRPSLQLVFGHAPRAVPVCKPGGVRNFLQGIDVFGLFVVVGEFSIVRCKVEKILHRTPGYVFQTVLIEPHLPIIRLLNRSSVILFAQGRLTRILSVRTATRVRHQQDKEKGQT